MMSQKKELHIVDYLIVGQGIAGTLLAYHLEKAGKKILVLEAQKPRAASSIAAGIVTPITGRRFVKSWMFEALLEAAKEVYAELEQFLDVKIWHERDTIKVLHDQKEENDWLARAALADYDSYIKKEVLLGNFQGKINPVFALTSLCGTARVDFTVLIKKYREKLLMRNAYIVNELHCDKIIFLENAIRYEMEECIIQAEKIIFCEGQWGRFNPYFCDLPFNPAKGELLLVKIPNAQFDCFFKQLIFIVPYGNDLYWVGSTNEHHPQSDEPSEAARQFLEARLTEILSVPFEVVAHHAAIRPTVHDRRPLLGLHPQFPQLAIFNGLGTKGASLAPYFAKMMSQFLVNNTPLSEEVDIQRHYTAKR